MLIVLNTCPDLKTAKALARKLVEKKLAACVNIIGVGQSVYRWKGRISGEKECLLLIKTAERTYARLEREIRNNHPYELPEIIAVKVERGNKNYIRWVGRSCSRAPCL